MRKIHTLVSEDHTHPSPLWPLIPETAQPAQEKGTRMKVGPDDLKTKDSILL